MRIIGIDLSLTRTGLCLLTDQTVMLRSLEHFAKGEPRMYWLMEEIREAARDCDLAVIEGLSYGAESSKKDELAGLFWLVRIALWKLQIPMMFVNPIHTKMFATGDSKADKSLIVRDVFRRWGVEAENNDEADAAVLAHIGKAWLGAGEWTQFQMDLIERLRKKAETPKPKPKRKRKAA